MSGVSETPVPSTPVQFPLRMLGDASVPVCVDDACVVPLPSGASDARG